MRAKLGKISVLVLLCLVLHKIVISCEEKNRSLDFVRGNQIEVSTEITEDEGIKDLLAPYKKDLDNKINEVLCYNPRLLDKRESDLESSLGNLLADVCFQAGDSILKSEENRRIDFAVFNYGGMRAPIEKGEVTVEDVYQLMPFENRLVVVELNPDQVKSVIDYLITRRRANPVSGIELDLSDVDKSQIKIGGNPYDPSRSYHVLTIDYLQHGGDGMSFLANPKYLYVTDIKVRDALIANFRSLDTLKTQLDGRLKDSKSQ